MKKARSARRSASAQRTWILRLYIAGRTERSFSALRNLEKVCEEHLAGRYRIEVIDLIQNPQLAAVYLSNIVPAHGALPIKIGDEVIGAIGISGAPGGDKDEACSKAGIEKVADQLK